MNIHYSLSRPRELPPFLPVYINAIRKHTHNDVIAERE